MLQPACTLDEYSEASGRVRSPSTCQPESPDSWECESKVRPQLAKETKVPGRDWLVYAAQFLMTRLPPIASIQGLRACFMDFH